MDRVDYNKALGSERRKFYETINDLKESQKRRIDNLERSHEAKQEKRAEHYRTELSDHQERFKNREKEMQEYVSRELDRKKGAIREKLSEVQDEYASRAAENRLKYGQRISDLNSKFQHNLDNQKRIHSRLQDSKEKNYKDNLRSLIEKNDESVEKLNKHYSEAGKKHRQESANELREAYNKREKDLNLIRREESERRSKLLSRNNESMQQVSEAGKKNLEAARDSYNDNLKNLRNRYDNNIEETVKNFEKIGQKQSERFSRAQKAQDDRHNRELKNLETKYERKLGLNQASGKDRSKVNELQNFYHDNIQKERNRYHQRLDRAREINEAHRLKMHDEIEDMSQRFAEESGKQKVIRTKNEAKLLHELATENQSNLSKERLKNLRMRDEFEKQTQNMQKEHDHKELLQERKHRIAQEERVKHHAYQIDDLELKHSKNLAGVRNDDLRDKYLYDKESSRKFAENSELLRRNYQTRMDTESRAYQSMISNLESERDRMELESESKFKKLQNEKAEQLIAQKEFHHEQMIEKDKENYNNNKYREEQLQANMEKLRRDYNSRFTEQAIKFEREMNQVTSDYEHQLRKQSNDFKKKFMMQQNQFKRDKNLQKLDFDKREQRLITHYENVINELKTRHELEEDNLRRFVQEERLKA